MELFKGQSLLEFTERFKTDLECEEYILLSKNDSDKKEGLIDVKYFNYSDIDEKEPNSTTKDNKKELEGRLKVFIPLIKEKDIKAFLKDF